MEVLYQPYNSGDLKEGDSNMTWHSDAVSIAGPSNLIRRMSPVGQIRSRSSVLKYKEIVRGVLKVTMERGESLTVADYLGLSDPYACVHMKRDELTKKKTRVRASKLTFKWSKLCETYPCQK